MSSLKDALLKAGVKGTHTENERKHTVPKKELKKTEIHQEQRNYCEVCNCTMPDVERYRHRNPLLEAQWICIKCADKYMIDDKFRVTVQSDYAKRNIFRREYGRTLRADEINKPASAPKKDSREPNGNRR